MTWLPYILSLAFLVVIAWIVWQAAKIANENKKSPRASTIWTRRAE